MRSLLPVVTGEASTTCCRVAPAQTQHLCMTDIALFPPSCSCLHPRKSPFLQRCQAQKNSVAYGISSRWNRLREEMRARRRRRLLALDQLRDNNAVVTIVCNCEHVVLSYCDPTRVVEPAKFVALEPKGSLQSAAAVKDLHAMISLICYYDFPVAAPHHTVKSERTGDRLPFDLSFLSKWHPGIQAYRSASLRAFNNKTPHLPIPSADGPLKPFPLASPTITLHTYPSSPNTTTRWFP